MENDSLYGQVIRLPQRKLRKARTPEALGARPTLTDVHPAKPGDLAGVGFVLSLLARTTGPILWVQDHASRRENGHLYTPGLKALGVCQPVLHVTVNHPRDVLWAMEEGASCGGLSAVIGEIHGAPGVLDFTATKRLAMRAETSGVSVYLIRSGDPGALSAARERWRLGALPSRPNAHDSQSPGKPQWQAELFRARGRPPGRWIAQYDPDAPRATDRLRLVSRPDAGAVAAGAKPVPDRAGG
ncbi:ImuA family protein [Roseobacter weihaiensis]|uniref:ImuA family protein n=1 Tax=Roseobacter weihaiensis TaxID=2763262 RepID=UPI001D0AC2EE|nr:hypothetical protein [Roseobacter sp. H9]